MPLAFAGPPSLQESDRPSGPQQCRGSRKNGQYVYWITYPFPKDHMLDELRPPNSFSRQDFHDVVLKIHSECGVDLAETVVFLELHEHGEPHLNCLVRSANQYRWKDVAEKLYEDEAIRVNFAPHITTWSQGIIYGRVHSEHKPLGMLDADPLQWAVSGAPTRFEDIIPRVGMSPSWA